MQWKMQITSSRIWTQFSVYIYYDDNHFYCRWRWQTFSLNPFTYANRPDNAKRIAGILFRDVIQPQANWENYDTEIFEQAENEDKTKYTIQCIQIFWLSILEK